MALIGREDDDDEKDDDYEKDDDDDDEDYGGVWHVGVITGNNQAR